MKNAMNAEGFCLDVGIKIRDNIFSINLCKKQGEFLFFTVRIPLICSNISCNIFCSTFGETYLRTARTASTRNSFKTSPNALLKRAQTQGSNAVVLKQIISKYFCRLFEVFQKFKIHLLHFWYKATYHSEWHRFCCILGYRRSWTV